MSSNRLKLNSDMTEFLGFGSLLHPWPLLSSIVIGNDSITASDSTRNIGVIFVKYMNFAAQVSAICKASFFQLRNMSHVRKFLSIESTKALVQTFITCKRAQLVQNCAARPVFNKRKFEHVTPLLTDLHWLPIKQCIVFKILVTTYKALNGLAPDYITDLLDRYVPTRSLRSSDQLLLKVPSTNNVSFGDRAFSVSAPKLWNSVPYEISSADNLNQFKS